MQRRSPSFYRKRREKQQAALVNVNRRIRAPRVVVIDEANINMGEMDTRDAITIAQERDMDLVEVNPKATPPICKILNFGQFQYEQEKHKQKLKSKQKKVEIKGIRISFRMSDHDKETRRNQARKFIDQGNKVKLDVVLRGREKAYVAQTKEAMESFAKSLGEDVYIEQPFTKQGGRLSLVIAQKK